MNYSVTAFPHHRSLDVKNVDLMAWLEEVSGSDGTWVKWDGPGFFPHVVLKTRYARNVERFTGLVQFDIDDTSYLGRYPDRSALITSLKAHPDCLLAYPSFSEFGLWGVCRGTIVDDEKEFQIMAARLIAVLEGELGILFDRRVSIEPRAFRLIPPCLP